MEIRYTAGGIAIGKFSLAVNRKKKSGEQWVDEASFFDVTCFGKTAENLAQYMTKGKQVGVDGSLHQDRWQDDSGQARSRVVINADNIQLLGGDKNTQGSAPDARNSTPRAPESDSDGFESDIPF